MRDRPERLSGGHMGQVIRVGNTVLRRSGEWTPAVHRLLRHLDGAGVPGIPHPLAETADGTEVLSFVEGSVPTYPMPPWVWSETALRSAAALLRRVHDATVGLDLSGPWQSPVRKPAEVVCHNDFAPYNLVFEGDRVVGAIDWDYASPGPRLWDLAYLAYRIVPLSTADWGGPAARTTREERLCRLLDAYGCGAHPGDVHEVLHERLMALAEFSDEAAERLHDPALREHAVLYRRDATRWSGG